MSSLIAQMNQLSHAIEQSNINEVRRLLDVPNAREIVNLCDAELYTSLFHTTRIVNQEVALEIMNLLLEKGANPYHKEENKQTILFYLAKEGRSKIIERLLTGFNFNLNDTDKYNQNPLYWAASHGRLKVAELLLRHGVEVNHLDMNNQTCLFYAAREGQLEMCKFLINRGCKFDILDKNKKNALHFAKTFKHHALVEYFNSLKETFKAKPQKESKQESRDAPPKKEKEKKVVRNQYVLVYTNEDGTTREVSGAELQDFLDGPGQDIYQYIEKPERLEDVDLKNDKKSFFLKTALKLVTGYLRRQDLSLFHEPVDTSKYIDYLDHVARPMDFQTIRQKINFNCYQTPQEFKEDVVMIYQNCMKYNGAESIYGQMAKVNIMEFLDTYKKEFTL